MRVDAHAQRRRVWVPGAVVGTGVAATYWRLMSPYSQGWGPFPYRARTAERVAALTFDDGPNEPYTSQIADLLDRRAIKATFFQVGRAVLRDPQVTRELAQSGHVIGHHGFSHDLRCSLRRSDLRHDIHQGLAAFATVGLRPALYRPPWLLRVPALREVLREQGLQAVSGEFCHALEVFQPRSDRIVRRTMDKVRPGCILIFHDGFDGKGADRSRTVETVVAVVDEMTATGYRFLTVDRLLGLDAYRPR